jgi:hypothetical protein
MIDIDELLNKLKAKREALKEIIDHITKENTGKENGDLSDKYDQKDNKNNYNGRKERD